MTLKHILTSVIFSIALAQEQDLGRAIVDIFRLENGKIVEHFDVIQQVPEKTANGNSMFEGSNQK